MSSVSLSNTQPGIYYLLYTFTPFYFTTAKPPVSSQAIRRQRNQQQTSSSTSHPSQGPFSILLSDTAMTPWEGLALCESSFTLIAPLPPPSQPPPAPRPTPSTPYCGRRSEEEASSSSFNSAPPSPPLVQNSAGMIGTKDSHI